MQYPGVALDKDGRAFECPVCRNTDLHDHGSYCIICGTRIDNLCLSAKNLSIKDMRQKNASEKESFNDIHSEGCGSNKPLRATQGTVQHVVKGPFSSTKATYGNGGNT